MTQISHLPRTRCKFHCYSLTSILSCLILWSLLSLSVIRNASICGGTRMPCSFKPFQDSDSSVLLYNNCLWRLNYIPYILLCGTNVLLFYHIHQIKYLVIIKCLLFFYHMLIFRVDNHAHNYADHAHSDHRYRTGPIG